jgi:hypothetical protein
VLETLDADTNTWTQVSWEMRAEDVALQEWAVLQVLEHHKRAVLDGVVLDADSEMTDAERAGLLLHSDEE